MINKAQTFDLAMINDDETAQAIDIAIKQIIRNLPEFTYSSQNHSSVNNFYPQVDNVQWTSGFWPGLIWLAYEHIGDKRLQFAGQIQAQSFLHRIQHRIETDHHDMGFLYTPSCVAAWKLVGDSDARQAAIFAADQLLDRYQSIGQFIQAWGNMSDPANYRYIIDALMNLPLLYWASAETGDSKYKDIAKLHAQTTLNNSIRPDSSTYHSFYMDRQTGEPLYGATVQGYKNDSAWARGQAWSVYGMALCYKHEKDDGYRDAFERVLAFYLQRLPDDLVPYWDLTFMEGNEPKDSSSASIVACGLLEMASLVEEDLAQQYKKLARQIIKSVFDNYAVKDPKMSNGLVLHGTYSNGSPFNTCFEEGVDECLSWGDYYYLEALTRLSFDWKSYW